MNILKSVLLGASLFCPTLSGAVTISAKVTGEITNTNWDLTNPVISAGIGGPAFGAGDTFIYSFDIDTAAAPTRINVFSTGQVNAEWAGSNGTITVGSVTKNVDTTFNASFLRVAGTSNTYTLDTFMVLDKPVAGGGVSDLKGPFFFERVQFTGSPLAFDPLSTFDVANLSAPVFPLEVNETFANIFCTVCTPEDGVSFDLGIGNLLFTETGRTTPPDLPLQPTPIPVPASFLLLLASLTGLGALASRRKAI